MSKNVFHVFWVAEKHYRSYFGTPNSTHYHFLFRPEEAFIIKWNILSQRIKHQTTSKLCFPIELSCFLQKYFPTLQIKILPLMIVLQSRHLLLKNAKDLLIVRDSGNDFGRFSVSFFEGRISYIRASCNYPTRNANF